MARSGATDRTTRWLAWLLRHARLVWVIALAAAIPAAYATLRLYLNLSGDVEELLPRDAASVRATGELRSRVSGLSTLGVVVDAGGTAQRPANLAAAEKLLDDLAARVRGYPGDLVVDVRTGTDEERRFFETYGPLYVELPDLSAIHQRIAARRNWETRRALGITFDEDERPPPVDFSDLGAKYKKKVPVATGAGSRFSSPESGVSILLIQGSERTASVKGAHRLLDRVRADLAALGGPEHYAPGMRVGFAGNVAVSVEELQALSEDLGVSTVLVVTAVLAVIWIFFGWWIAIPALLIPLALGTLIAFGLAALLPFGIDRLNSSTAFLGSIVVGNGVNFGIIWLARYAEARRRGQPVEAALDEAIRGARPGTLIAALAAATSYGSLIVTQFRGFRQFGIIGAIGMLACWATTFVLSPSLLLWLERRAGRAQWPPRRLARQRTAPGAAPSSWLAARLARGAGPVVLIAAIVTAAAVFELRRLDSSRIESDFSRLRRHDTWTSGEGYWGRKMDRVLQRNLSPTVILTDSTAAALAVARRVRAETQAGSGPLGELVAQVRAIDDVLPPDQEQKIEEIRAIQRLITPLVRAQLSDRELDELNRFIGRGPPTPVRPEQLPSALTAGLRERDGSLGRTVLVFPRLTKLLWQTDRLTGFVAGLRDIAARAVPPEQRPGRVAGYLPVAADIALALRRDGPLASGIALLAVAVVVMVVFRGHASGLWVLGSLVLGVLWMTAAMLRLGVKANYINFVAFPITFGVGVDYAVNIMARYRQELAKTHPRPDPGSPRVWPRIEALRAAVAETGGAVALCSLTTSLGYSSLLIAKNRALMLFGVFAVAGEVSCLSTAVIVLPAVLLFALSQRLGPRRRSLEQGQVAAPSGQ